MMTIFSPFILLTIVLCTSPAAKAARLPRTTMLQFTTPPWPATTIPTCPEENMLAGEQRTFYEQGACRVCQCSFSGGLSCYYADCLVPMCVDAHRRPRDCCATCPNGRNCRVPQTGEIIMAGAPVEKNGLLCECPPQSYMLPGIQSEADYTAICHPTTTIPPTMIG